MRSNKNQTLGIVTDDKNNRFAGSANPTSAFIAPPQAEAADKWQILIRLARGMSPNYLSETSENARRHRRSFAAIQDL
jgi:hypothetical protein